MSPSAISENQRLLTVSYCRTRLQQIDEYVADNHLPDKRQGSIAQNRKFFAEQLEIALKKEGFK
jgi:hypothetical protein